MKLRLGCDPEVFLLNQQGKFVSSIDKVGGSKLIPRQLEGMEKGFTVQEDNVALEFGIPPASSAKDFVSKIRAVMKETQEKIVPGYHFSNVSCVSFPEEEMKDTRAFVFGCEPDFNAWTKEQNVMPEVNDLYLRSAGGHIHVETNINKEIGVKYMDLFVGIPSVLMDQGHLRKQLYGKAGAYRPKPYGFEYRTPSNYWIFNDDLIEWVWRNTEYAIVHADQDDLTIDNYSGLINDAINNNNTKVAQELVDAFGLEVLHVC